MNILIATEKNMVTMSHGADEEIFKTYNPGRVFISCNRFNSYYNTSLKRQKRI